MHINFQINNPKILHYRHIDSNIFFIFIYINFNNIKMSLFDLSHFKENCPVEARNYFKEILNKLESIEKRLDSLEKKS